jgi:uncharacterized protein
MQIDLSKVLARDDERIEVRCELETDTVDFGSETFPIRKKELFSLEIVHLNRHRITIRGNTKVTAGIPCDRCLREVPVDFVLVFDRDVDLGNLSEKPEEEQEVRSFLKENILDVDAFAMNEILVAWPSKTLCSAACRGICKKCGKNLNEGECGCDQTELDPRMAAIRDIFYENYKEEV